MNTSVATDKIVHDFIIKTHCNNNRYCCAQNQHGKRLYGMRYEVASQKVSKPAGFYV